MSKRKPNATTCPDFFTLKQVADRQKRSKKTILREIDRGALAAYKFGGTWRISAEDLSAYEALRRLPAKRRSSVPDVSE